MNKKKDMRKEDARFKSWTSCFFVLFFFFGGVLEDDNLLSMHLESHIGRCSASLYDFNGKAL